jgi:hypothetical protein
MPQSVAEPLAQLSEGLALLHQLSTPPAHIGRLLPAQTVLFRTEIQTFCARHPVSHAPSSSWDTVNEAIIALENLCWTLRAALVDPLADPNDAAVEAELFPLHQWLCWALDGADGVWARSA